MEKKKAAPRKKREKKPTNSVRFAPGTYGPDWWNYPPEWDAQAKKLQEDWERLHEPIK
jgi:hypothetical protein